MKLLKLNVAALLVAASAALAAPYPEKPVRLIVPFPPGGPTDIVGRALGHRLGAALGQPVVVENRPGAAGALGVEAVAKAQPDGYTIGLGSTGTLAITPSLSASLGYDPLKSFATISLLVKTPLVVAVNASLPVLTLRELIELAKTRPGQINFGSAGTGGAPHIAGEMFKAAVGVDLRHVPYKGAAPALTDLLAGRIQVLFDQPGTLLPHVRAGKVRVLAVASSSPVTQLPGVPTAGEAGVPGYEVSVWFGLLAPAGTPSEVVDRLSLVVGRELAVEEMRELFAKQGLEASANSPAEFSAFIAAEHARWSRAVKAAGVKLD